MSDFFADTGAWFEQGFIDIGNVILGNSKAPDNDPVTGLSEVDVRHDPVSEHSATDVWYGPVDDTYFDSITNIDFKLRQIKYLLLQNLRPGICEDMIHLQRMS